MDFTVTIGSGFKELTQLDPMSFDGSSKACITPRRAIEAKSFQRALDRPHTEGMTAEAVNKQHSFGLVGKPGITASRNAPIAR